MKILEVDYIAIPSLAFTIENLFFPCVYVPFYPNLYDLSRPKLCQYYSYLLFSSHQKLLTSQSRENFLLGIFFLQWLSIRKPDCFLITSVFVCHRFKTGLGEAISLLKILSGKCFKEYSCNVIFFMFSSFYTFFFSSKIEL